MVSIIDKLVEVTKYEQQAAYEFWILISYRESIWKEETFKEAVLINIEKDNYHRDNILKDSYLQIKIEIEEIRTINFPLGSILDKEGNVLFTPSDCGYDKFIYDYEIFINTQRDILSTLNNEELVNIDFILGVPCYLLKSSGIEYILPIHAVLDFLFYHDTEITNILVNDFDQVDSLSKKSINTLLFSSSIINQDIVEKIGFYFFTASDKGLKALKNINAHRTVWMNQRKLLQECRAYITTEFAFSPALLKVKGMFLTEYKAKSRKFLVFGIEEIYPYRNCAPFINVDKIFLEDLTDRRSIEAIDKEYIESSESVSVKVDLKNMENYKLTDLPINNSLPGIENKTLRSKKINLNIQYQKVEKKEQNHNYRANNTVMRNINGVSTNYNDYDTSSAISKIISKVIDTDFSFFKVFFKAMDILSGEGCKVEYLMLNEVMSSNITLLPCSSVSKLNLSYLLISICQIEINQKNYVLIEAGENYYIGMFKCIDNNKFDILKDLRLLTFLRKVINRHDYNWSKINSKENINCQKRDRIKIFRPIVHPSDKARSFLIAKKSTPFIIHELAEKLVEKIRKRIKEDVKIK